MENLELGSASDVKNDAASMIPRRSSRRCKLSSVWSLLFIFAISALVYVSVALYQTRQNDAAKTTSINQPQSTSAAGGSSSGSDENAQVAATSNNQPQTVCDIPYDCQTDRMGHETPLYAGQGLCNKQYRFGVTTEGIFQWYDCATQTSRVIYDATCQENNGKALPHYFSMSPEATMRLFDDQDQIIWQKESKLSISFSPRCLHSPALDCPYLHLHAEGTLVLNSVSDAGWSNRKIEKAFEDLFLNYTILNC